MAIDPDENYIVACSDFGHIFVHSVDGDLTKSKTLRTQYAPFISLHFTILNGVSVVLWLVVHTTNLTIVMYWLYTFGAS